MVGICVPNAEYKTFCFMSKMEPFRAEETGKPRETWRQTIEKDIAEVGKTLK